MLFWALRPQGEGGPEAQLESKLCRSCPMGSGLGALQAFVEWMCEQPSDDRGTQEGGTKHLGVRSLGSRPSFAMWPCLTSGFSLGTRGQHSYPGHSQSLTKMDGIHLCELTVSSSAPPFIWTEAKITGNSVGRGVWSPG